ncbi:hypothetical protein LUQ84_3476 [Hamiltosporidium tvaerminnensis]|nr:hypothetical protein LUQ84_3476 [Hamiltosporidium tvaerminnensis]
MDDQAYSMLPYFYENIFPLERIFQWLKIDEKREISFTLQNGMYLRYLNFKSKEELLTKILSTVPVKIDFGAVYANRLRKGTECIPVEKELVFDIDLTDYKRTCCTGRNTCETCFVLVKSAIKLLNYSLKEEFGFEKVLFVFSGGRGIHCWVSDDNARSLNNSERQSVTKFFDSVSKRKIFPTEYCNILMENIAEFNEPDLNIKPETATVEEIFEHLYIKLDKNVTSEIKHLLKSPFCVHSSTTKVCVPLDPENIDTVLIEHLPTLQNVMDNPKTLDPYIRIFDQIFF